MTMINDRSPLRRFQRHNQRLYLVTNDRDCSNEKILVRILIHVGRVLKAARKKKYDAVPYHLCMAMSWCFAVANRFHIDLADEMWSRFPGFCPYCINAPCSCKTRRKRRRKNGGRCRGRKPVSMRRWQKMFAGIYPNAVEDSAIHLAEEAIEVIAALLSHSETHQEKWFWKAVEELVDVVTNIFGVANCLGIDMASAMASYFAGSCPGCRRSPCACGYVATDDPKP